MVSYKVWLWVLKIFPQKIGNLRGDYERRRIQSDKLSFSLLTSSHLFSQTSIFLDMYNYIEYRVFSRSEADNYLNAGCIRTRRRRNLDSTKKAFFFLSACCWNVSFVVTWSSNTLSEGLLKINEALETILEPSRNKIRWSRIGIKRLKYILHFSW